MKSNAFLYFAVSFVIYLDSTSSRGSGLPQRSWGEAAKAIQRAASLPGGSGREDALRSTLRAGLTGSDSRIVDEVFEYLSANQRWLDLRPYASILQEVDPRQKRRANWLLDEAELAHASRADRLKWFETAIVNGEVVLPHGRPLTRELAMSFAALQGLKELELLTQQFLPQVDERWRKSFQADSFATMFDLGEGAEDREDALRLASERIARMSDSDLRTKAEQDPSFQLAMLQVAEDVCISNPFSGRRNDGCQRMKEVTKRQIHLEGTVEGIVSESVEVGPRTEPNWLKKLRQRLVVD